MSRRELHFAPRFAISLVVLLVLSKWSPVVSHLREPLCGLWAASLARAFTWAGLAVRLDGDTVSSEGAGGGAFRIIPECDGITLYCLFLAGVVAVPFWLGLRAWREALVGLVVLAVLNWLRLAALAVSVFSFPSAYEMVHSYILQGALILCTFVVYAAWLGRALGADRPATGSASIEREPR